MRLHASGTKIFAYDLLRERRLDSTSFYMSTLPRQSSCLIEDGASQLLDGADLLHPTGFDRILEQASHARVMVGSAFDGRHVLTRDLTLDVPVYNTGDPMAFVRPSNSAIKVSPSPLRQPREVRPYIATSVSA